MTTPTAPPVDEQRPPPTDPAQALPAPEIGAPVALAGGMAAGTIAAAAGTAAGLAATAPAVPLIRGTKESIEAILEGLRSFFLLSRARHERWIVQRGLERKAPQQAILDLIADESAYQAEFQRKVIARVTRDAATALQLPLKERDEAVQKILRRERVYARQRSEAMAVRGLAAIDRVVLKRDSPQGAFWKLDPAVLQHTPDCIAMSGKVWPWEVLDDFHPPVHAGCRCSLHGYLEAIAAGWIGRGTRLMDVATAKRKAEAARALLHEEEVQQLWEACVSRNVCTSREFVRAWVDAA